MLARRAALGCCGRRVLRTARAPPDPMRVCAIVRDVVYGADPRWAATARDPEYARLFPPSRGWWPPSLAARLENKGMV
jgi:hypothetical protein